MLGTGAFGLQQVATRVGQSRGVPEAVDPRPGAASDAEASSRTTERWRRAFWGVDGDGRRFHQPARLALDSPPLLGSTCLWRRRRSDRPLDSGRAAFVPGGGRLCRRVVIRAARLVGLAHSAQRPREVRRAGGDVVALTLSSAAASRRSFTRVGEGNSAQPRRPSEGTPTCRTAPPASSAPDRRTHSPELREPSSLPPYPHRSHRPSR